MRNVSNQYIETMANRRDFYAEAEITFADGQTKTVNKKDFWISGNSFTHSAGGSSFPLGMLIAKRIAFSLNNENDQWSEYDFFGAKIQLFTRFKLDDGTVESLNMGEFTVITPEAYGTTVEVTAMDESYKTDIEYSTGLAAPIPIGIALRDSCATCGITLLTTTFKNDDFVINTIPEKITHRQFIGLCAMLAGGNAVLDEYNRLKIITYDLSALEVLGLDGGKFDKLGLSEYVTGDTADGGSFAPWNVGYIADGGTFGDRKNIHVLYEVKSGMTVGVDDVVITGVQMQDEDDNIHLYGKEGYVVFVENQLAAGKENEAVQRIGDIIVGLRFRPFTAEHIAYPLAEFMDPAFLIDRKQNVYQTVLTDIEFKYFGFTTLKCTADSPLRNSSKYNNESAKAVIAARKVVNEKISQYDLAMQTLTNLMTQSFGVFKTEEVLEDGSTIFYMHNKPTLEESQTIWKMTADAFAVSTDGGKTWNAGIDSEGNAVVNVLSAIGIQFDWAKGGTLSLGGDNNVNGQIYIFNSDGKNVGVINNNGIAIYSPTTKLQVVISPNVGFVLRDADGNEFYGLSFDSSEHLPAFLSSFSPDYYYTDNKKYTGCTNQPIKQQRICYCYDYDTVNYTQIGSKQEGIYTSYSYRVFYKHSSVSYPGSFTKVRNAPDWDSMGISSKRIIDDSGKTLYSYDPKKTALTFQLPESFKNKNISVNVIMEYENPYSGLSSDNAPIVKYSYASLLQPKCYDGLYYDTDYTILDIGTMLGIYALSIDVSKAPDSPHINPNTYVPDSDREVYTKSNNYSFPSEFYDYDYSYSLDSDNAVITIEGWAIGKISSIYLNTSSDFYKNFISMNEFMKFRVLATC